MVSLNEVDRERERGSAIVAMALQHVAWEIERTMMGCVINVSF